MPDLKTLQAEGNPGRGELGRDIQALGPWFHNLHLPDGTQTAPDHPLGDFPAFKWRSIAPHLPEDLSGWRVLDVGCNAGFYSFALAERGADVLGVDHDEHYLRQARWACERMGLSERVRFLQATVYELSHYPEDFDLVMFMGVFYHLRYPLLALDILAEKTRRQLVFQSLSMPGKEVVEDTAGLTIEQRQRMREDGWPKMAFIEHDLAGDPTNWWAPNHACMEAMLRSAGLRVRARPADEIYLCEADTDASPRAAILRDTLDAVRGPERSRH